MNKKLNKKDKILILGASGLVGSNLAVELLKAGYKNITLHSLGKKNEDLLLVKYAKNKFNLRIKWVYGNVMVDISLKKYSFFEIISSGERKKRLERYIRQPLNRENVSSTFINFIVKQVKPAIIFDCINTATQSSYLKGSGDIFKDAGIGMFLLLRYFQALNLVISNSQSSNVEHSKLLVQYIKIGTTGIGGMGLNLPFTHGEDKPSIELLKKVAFAGSQTNLLQAINRNSYLTKIKEVIPATSIFSREIVIENINGSKHLSIPGGESGNYSIEEFRLLTDRNLMGVVTADNLAKVIRNTLSNDKYNVISALEKSSIKNSKKSQSIRNIFLMRCYKVQKKTNIHCITHGKLGPNFVKKLLLEAEIFSYFWRNEGINFFKKNDERIKQIIISWALTNQRLLKDIKIAGGSINLMGRKSKAARVKNTEKTGFIISIDRRTIFFWKKFFRSISEKNINLSTGDIVSKILVNKTNERMGIF